MRNEVCDMFRDWLDGPRGIAWQLSCLEYADGDVPPPPPNVVVVAHRNEVMMRDGGSWPAGEVVVAVIMDDGIKRGPHGPGGAVVAANSASAVVKILVTVRSGNVTQKMVQLGYLMRAVERCVRYLWQPAPGFDTTQARRRHGICLVGIPDAEYDKVFLGDGVEVVGLWAGTCQLLDTQPYAPALAAGHG